MLDDLNREILLAHKIDMMEGHLRRLSITTIDLLETARSALNSKTPNIEVALERIDAAIQDLRKEIP